MTAAHAIVATLRRDGWRAFQSDFYSRGFGSQYTAEDLAGALRLLGHEPRTAEPLALFQALHTALVAEQL